MVGPVNPSAHDHDGPTVIEMNGQTDVAHVLYAGNTLNKARLLFQAAIEHRRCIRLTIRQRTRGLKQWPKE